MANVDCSEANCTDAVKARGVCAAHYHLLRKSGFIAANPIGPRVTDIDIEAKTGTCPIHGADSRLRIRPNKSEGTPPHISCRACNRGHRGHNRKTPDGRASYRRRRKYGLSDEEFAIMQQSQGGRCLICHAKPKVLVIDHDHVSGVVRGLLCHRCNVALGWMNDDATNLARAAKYLRRNVA